MFRQQAETDVTNEDNVTLKDESTVSPLGSTSRNKLTERCGSICGVGSDPVRFWSSQPELGTCVDDPLYLDALVVQLLGEGVDGLQQVFTRLRVDVGPPCRDLNWITERPRAG